jgi:hypothetical protein
MAEKKPKNYISGSAKLVSFPNGSELINVDLKLEDIQNLPVSKSGYVKLVLSKLAEKGKFGDDYSIYENEFKPDPKMLKTPRSVSGEITSPLNPKATDSFPF